MLEGFSGFMGVVIVVGLVIGAVWIPFAIIREISYAWHTGKAKAQTRKDTN